MIYRVARSLFKTKSSTTDVIDFIATIPKFESRVNAGNTRTERSFLGRIKTVGSHLDWYEDGVAVVSQKDRDEYFKWKRTNGPQKISSFKSYPDFVEFALVSTTEILRPNGCRKNIFIKENASHITVSSDLQSLARGASVDWKYIFNKLTETENQSNNTIFEGVTVLPPGHAFNLKDSRLSRKTTATKLASYIEILPRIESCISKTSVGRIIPIEFSGGLESSILLKATEALNDPSQIICLHVTSSAHEESDDLRRATEIVEKTGAKLKIFDASKNNLFDFTPIANYRPEFPHRGLLNMEYFRFKLEHTGGSPCLNGSGGDAVFCNFPLLSGVVDTLITRGPVAAYRHNDQLSKYWRASRINCAVESLREAARWYLPGSGTKRDGFRNDFLNLPTSFSPSRPKQRWLTLPGRAEQIKSTNIAEYEAFTMPQSSWHGSNVFPFLDEKVTQAALSMPLHSFFANGHDRYPIRRMAELRYGDSIFWQRKKGGIMGATQVAVNNHMAEIEVMLCEGLIAREGFLKKDTMRKEIRSVGLGAQPCSPALLDMLAIEVFFRHWTKNA